MRHTKDCTSRYETKACERQLLQPNQSTIHTLLERNEIPLLAYHRDSRDVRRLDVEPFTGSELFVVVSHVWSDGLGNTTGNALLACQVDRLAELVRRFSRFHGQQVYFWIDSICVPVKPKETRRNAIRRMFDVYSYAHSTIVMSASLMDQPAREVDYLPIAMRISMSSWMRRLWTVSHTMQLQHDSGSVFDVR